MRTAGALVVFITAVFIPTVRFAAQPAQFATARPRGCHEQVLVNGGFGGKALALSHAGAPGAPGFQDIVEVH